MNFLTGAAVVIAKTPHCILKKKTNSFLAIFWGLVGLLKCAMRKAVSLESSVERVSTNQCSSGQNHSHCSIN